jgi:hypothetical protein
MQATEKSLLRSRDHILDVVVYLASLASDPKALDPILSTVRFVTANVREDGKPLSDADVRKLETVRGQLEDHLLHKETVRHFTQKTLEVSVQEHFGTGTRALHRTRHEVVSILAIVAGCFITGFLLTPSLSMQQRWLIGIMLGLGAFYLGIAWLFWSGLRTFSAKLQNAYRYICVGYLITGVGIAIMPLGPAFPYLTDMLLRYSVIMPVFIVGNIFIYLGTRIFARLLDVQLRASSLRLVFGVAALAGVLSMFLPHPTTEPSELWFDITVASGFVMAVLATGSTLLARAISRATTEMYARAMRWFSYTMALVAISSVVASVMILFKGKLEDFMPAFIFYCIDGALMMTSAYLFKRSSGAS